MGDTITLAGIYPMPEPYMTPEAFTDWLETMKAAGKITSDAHAARELGVHPNSIVRLKLLGADRRTSLACTALWHDILPWGETLKTQKKQAPKPARRLPKAFVKNIGRGFNR